MAVPSAATAGPADQPVVSVAAQPASPANATAADNPCAGISGVSSQAVGGCPYGATCVYTDTYWRDLVGFRCGCAFPAGGEVDSGFLRPPRKNDLKKLKVNFLEVEDS
ncbi:hypothetical protein OG992_06685 [Micromonospora sp. NBC_00362]|uniref:hypothetical protein n=1 Tax=Micromonospora sp. NBC_00362 TaxID=2975975 RepID=UPI00224F870D|nr:hypothetical protein [Micromonospora sp. NBC_00362]MCX5116859.1 hypothetical protein [Micromonospora sp. NBC_00362]